MIAFKTLKQFLLNFSHRKALVAYSFPSVIRPLVTFQEYYFLRDTLQVILVLIISISSFFHVRGLRKRRSDRQMDRQTDFGYYYIDVSSS
jgi:positive regulator of sigma E activity